jgi:hypothetical protein
VDLDAAAERLQQRVYNRVLKDPSGRARIVGRSVRAVRGQAIRAGAADMDPSTFVRRRLGRFASRPLPLPTQTEHDARAYERRLSDLRRRGVEVVQVGGRWLRRNQRGKLVPVETETELVQRRVARAERQAVASARVFARKKGMKGPPARGRVDWNQVDPAVYAFYAKRVAMESSRVAHDALVDAYRDAALDRAEQLQVGWVRECETTACGACLALADGTVHPWTDRRFYRHTRCRCKPVPARGRKPPRTGRQIFDSLTAAKQDALFHGRGGARKAALLRSGAVELPDLVQIARDRADWTDYVVTETPLEGLVAATD